MGQHKKNRSSAARPRRKRGGVPVLVWVGLVAVLAIVIPLVRPRPVQAKHPTPRPNITAAGMQSPAMYGDMPETADAYRMAEEIPEIIDGIYCYCDCSNHMMHRSLVDCFKSDHAAGCDVCQQEARTAYKMHKEGKSLEQIRQTIDAWYGKGA